MRMQRESDRVAEFPFSVFYEPKELECYGYIWLQSSDDRSGDLSETPLVVPERRVHMYPEASEQLQVLARAAMELMERDLSVRPELASRQRIDLVLSDLGSNHFFVPGSVCINGVPFQGPTQGESLYFSFDGYQDFNISVFGRPLDLPSRAEPGPSESRLIRATEPDAKLQFENARSSLNELLVQLEAINDLAAIELSERDLMVVLKHISACTSMLEHYFISRGLLVDTVHQLSFLERHSGKIGAVGVVMTILQGLLGL